jgi:hypothetical protein
MQVTDKQKNKTGKFLGIPYDWRAPTKARYRSRMWNPGEPRFITPRAFGWGYDFNLYRLFHRSKRT